MNIVDAANKTEIAMISEVLKKRYSQIYGDIWKVGLNLSLRVGDLLGLKYSDFDLEHRTLTLIEEKTGKPKFIRLNTAAIEVIAKRMTDFPDDIWLFQVHSNRAKGKPISRCSVSRAFKEAGDWLGLNINTHTMRKSRGKAMYDDKVPIEMIAKVLNHSNIHETMRYLGITKENIMQTYDDYVL